MKILRNLSSRFRTQQQPGSPTEIISESDLQNIASDIGAFLGVILHHGCVPCRHHPGVAQLHHGGREKPPGPVHISGHLPHPQTPGYTGNSDTLDKGVKLTGATGVFRR